MNKKNGIEKYLNFLNYFYTLKEIERTGWKTKLPLRRPESVAEHTLTTMVLSLIIAECCNYSPAKTVKMIKMAMIHDLGESIIGDYMPNTIESEKKRKLESDAINNIISKIQWIEKRKSLLKVWAEFYEGKTDDSNLIHIIDKLDMALQAEFYLRNNKNIDRKDVKPFLDSALNYIMAASKSKRIETQSNADNTQSTDEIEQILLYL